MVRSLQMLQECCGIARDVHDGSISPEGFDQFWRTMLWDLDANLKPPSAETGTAFRKLLRDCSTVFDGHDEEWRESFIMTSQAIEPLLSSLYEEKRFCRMES
jgi:hypothetical protein